MRVRVRVEAELEEDLFDVRLDGALSDEQAPSDSPVGESFRDEAENFSLAPGQLGERIFAALAADEARDDRRIR